MKITKRASIVFGILMVFIMLATGTVAALINFIQPLSITEKQDTYDEFTYSFTAKVDNRGIATPTYYWDFGDGSTSISFPKPGESLYTYSTTTHTYLTPGWKTVKVTVTGEHGYYCEDTTMVYAGP